MVNGEIEPEVGGKGPAAGGFQGIDLLGLQVRIARSVGIVPGLRRPERLHIKDLGGQGTLVEDESEARGRHGAVITAVVVPHAEKEVDGFGKGGLGLGINAEQAIAQHVRIDGGGRSHVRGTALGDGNGLYRQMLLLKDETEGKAPARPGSPSELSFASYQVIGPIVPVLPARRVLRRSSMMGDRIVRGRWHSGNRPWSERPRFFPFHKHTPPRCSRNRICQLTPWSLTGVRSSPAIPTWAVA